MCWNVLEVCCVVMLEVCCLFLERYLRLIVPRKLVAAGRRLLPPERFPDSEHQKETGGGEHE